MNVGNLNSCGGFGVEETDHVLLFSVNKIIFISQPIRAEGNRMDIIEKGISLYSFRDSFEFSTPTLE